MLYLFFRQQEYLMVKNIGQIQYFLPYKRYERRGRVTSSISVQGQ